MVKERAAAGDVTLTLEIDSGLPMLVTDERAFRQMLLNLLGNAVQFTPAAGRVVLAARIEQDGRMAVGVARTGIGLKKVGRAPGRAGGCEYGYISVVAASL